MQPLLQALYWSPAQTRIDYKLSTAPTTSSLTHLLPISLTFSLCTPLPGSCVLLQTNGHFVSPMLEQNPLANTVSPTCSCFSSVLLAMEFAPYWHPSYSALPSLQNLLRSVRVRRSKYPLLLLLPAIHTHQMFRTGQQQLCFLYLRVSSFNCFRFY